MKLMKSCSASVIALSVSLVVLTGGAARAQTAANPITSAATAPKPGLVAPKPVPALSFKKTAVTDVVSAIARATGTNIVTNSLIASIRIDFTTIGGTLDSVLTQLSAVLPPTSTVRAVLLPNSVTAGVSPDGDAIVAYLSAQDILTKPLLLIPSTAKTGSEASTVSPTTPPPPSYVPDNFEALGQHLDKNKAVALSAEMNLAPVYLVSMSRPPADPVGKMGALQTEALRNYAAMTPDQRKQAMEQQFNDMMNMDKGARQALLGQMMDQGAYMMNMMKNMPPAQMQEFQNEMMTAMQNSGLVGANGAGGKGGGATGK